MHNTKGEDILLIDLDDETLEAPQLIQKLEAFLVEQAARQHILLEKQCNGAAVEPLPQQLEDLGIPYLEAEYKEALTRLRRNSENITAASQAEALLHLRQNGNAMETKEPSLS